MSGSPHSCRQIPIVITMTDHFPGLNMSHVESIRPFLALLPGVLECLGCGVMMYISANVVQCTLEAVRKHEHETS